MVNLDDLLTYQQGDPAEMLGHLRRLPQQCQEAWQRGMGLFLPVSYRRIKRVVIAGMGGSAMGGDLIKALVSQEGLPVLVHRDYDLPPGIDSQTLVVLSSYSGMTEETLSSLAAALKSPGKLIVVTSGGKLKATALEQGIPVLCIDYAGPPRAALGYGFVGLLGVLCRLGLHKDKEKQVAEMIAVMEKESARLVETTPLFRNPAKGLAARLHGRLVVIYGGGFLAPVARRWKTQLNENSKSWAFFESFPELNHNAVVGLEFPQMADSLAVILLRSQLLHPRTLLRYKVTSQILTRKGIAHEILDARGQSPLAQMMHLVLLGDYVSYYLALLNEVAPAPVEAIDYLKRQLSQG